jgi:hypothetical protein
MYYIFMLVFVVSCFGSTETIVEKQNDGRINVPPPIRPRVNFVSFEAFESEALEDLTGLVSAEQANARYISLCDKVNAGEFTVEMVRGVQKALNQISLEVSPEPGQIIGEGQCTIRIDQRDFGLDGSKWNIIENDDPLKFESFTDRGILIKQLTGTARPWILGSNFVETALIRSYYDLLEIPNDEGQFLQSIGCNLQRDFDDFSEDLFMAAVRRSLIALQKNRSVLITDCRDGMMSATYDVQLEDITSAGRNLSINPFPVEALTNNTFQDDASEFIFTLPNGMLGYALFAGGVREDFAPTNIVVDNVRANIDPTIRNARSCSSCHNTGFLEVDDFIADHTRGNPNFSADEIQKAQAYFGRNQAMKAAMRQANQKYANVLRELNVPTGTDAINSLTDTIRQEMTAKQVAGMFFLQERDFLEKLQASPDGVLSIGQLLNGGTINFQDLVQIAPTLIVDLNLFQEDLGQ